LSGRTAYADAGVDIEAGDRAVDMLRSRLGLSGGDLLGGIGAFAAVLELPENVHHPVLVAATDGVGTKTEIARRLRRLDTIGEDLVAMCADDVVCHGAQPTYFLDYLAVGRVVPEMVAEIVGGIGRACAAIGCAVVGGETAEHPGLMDVDAFDLAGFCIGFVERDEIIDGSAARPGDVVIGLASSGLHANGYSLVRALIGRGALPLDDSLLTPTRIYAPAVLDLVSTLRSSGARVGGLAHITGGGLAGNLPRAVGHDLGIRVSVGAWPEPRIFGTIARAAGMGGAEMRATFNCGIGFAVVVQEEARQATIDILATAGIDAWAIGEVRPAHELAGARYVEAS
jgi:phosphoribosylformylglycinamidine cyclo-ligase